MLGLFRKYQKFVFLFVTVIIVISFTFFGAVNTFNPAHKAPPDKVIGKAVDGSYIWQNEMQALSSMLEGGSELKGYIYTGKMPNLLNDGVIFKDFLATQTANILAEKYFDIIKPDLEERLAKIKSYRPYQHPTAQRISASLIWGQVLPKVNEDLQSIQAMTEVTPQFFSKLCSLYSSQTQFSPEILKQFLMYQQSQYAKKSIDPLLEKADLSLFGFHTIENWFGKRFLDLASQFILNASIVAEDRGYKVSLEDAKVALYQNTYSGLQSLVKEEELASLNIAQYVHHQIASLGIDEPLAIKLWRKVLLFRALFNEVGASVFIDPLMQEQFASFANEAAKVELYQLPEHLRLKDFSSLLKLQVYIDAVSPNKGKSLFLPAAYLSPDAVEKKVPELVQRSFLIEYAEVKKEDFALKTSLKDLWDWELQEENFDLLRKEYPFLKSSKNREDRFAILENLNPQERFKIDSYARNCIVQKHPEWIDVALANLPLRKEKISLRGKGSRTPFKGVEDTKELLSLLLGAESKIDRFTFDNEHFYKIHVLEKPSSKEILTFAEANQDHTLDTLLENRLKDSYDGQKPIKEVQDQVGQKLYADLLKAIQEDYTKVAKKEAPSSLDFYVNHRLYAYIREALKNLQKNPQDEQILVKQNEKVSLENQWRLLKAEKEITREGAQGNGKEDLFSLNEGAWSNVHFSKYGDLCFSHLLTKSLKKDVAQEKIIKLKEHLSSDAKRLFMHNLVQEILDKHAIDFSKVENKEVL